ncbi:MAG: hypothetical protein LE180_00300 [Endomicrobium sp.]|uniref:hypothetical protein n=1 Tax=Candidatus Endomicrobiellum pyrsonymphae TaxID=1408203 RepID=UPI003586DA04|nr:hypothetical protein [Endomicrobium sp.]
MRRIKRKIVLCCFTDFGYTEEKFCEKGDGTDRTNGHKMYMKCSEKQRPARNECFKSWKCTEQEISDDHAEMTGMYEKKEKFCRNKPLHWKRNREIFSIGMAVKNVIECYRLIKDIQNNV